MHNMPVTFVFKMSGAKKRKLVLKQNLKQSIMQ